jgi:hypothetical protein
MDRRTAITAALILIVLIAVAALIYQPRLENPRLAFKEELLEKNTQLQLQPGEVYTYTLIMNNTPVNITYLIMEGQGCMIIRVAQSVNFSGTCVDEWGMDGSGYNSALSSPSVLMFRPWMLALKEGWRWNNSMYLEYNGKEEFISDTHYRVIRSEDLNGRQSFLVEIKSDTGPAEYQWIDAQKRVLLKSVGEDYEVLLQENLSED